MTVSSRGVNTGEDLAEGLAQASGQYVLSASKAGEESFENEEYKLEGQGRGHGAFTYSLLRGLGAAAVDTSGVVWLSDLFGHVSREVPRLTEGRQHPYSQSEGTDLPLFVLTEGSLVDSTFGLGVLDGRGGRICGDRIGKALANTTDTLIGEGADCALEEIRGNDGKARGPNDAGQLQSGLSEVRIRGANDLIDTREFVTNLR